MTKQRPGLSGLEATQDCGSAQQRQGRTGREGLERVQGNGCTPHLGSLSLMGERKPLKKDSLSRRGASRLVFQNVLLVAKWRKSENRVGSRRVGKGPWSQTN